MTKNIPKLPIRLLEKLACPKCHGSLQYNEDADRLVCGACRLGYDVRQGVPVLLIDEATKIQ